MVKITVSLERARAFWFRRQGLDRPFPGDIGEVIAATGWVRTLGGADVYLSTRARRPGMKRAELDAACESARVQVLPAVRGCIYLVPATHASLALKVAEEAWRKRIDRELEKVGVKWKEIEQTADVIAGVLKKEPLSTDGIRKAVPEGIARSLGEKGKKIGMTSTLPVALRHLEFAGTIERTLEGGRLDTERYVWRKSKKKPGKAPSDPAARLAEIYAEQMGPVSAKDFAEWAALSQRDATAAMQRAGLVEVEVEGYGKAFARERDLEELAAAEPSTTPAMLSFEDNYLVAHGGPALLTDPSEHKRKIDVWGTTRGSTLGTAKHLAARTLFVGEKLAGFWEFDPDARRIVTGTFMTLDTKAKKKVAELAESVCAFLEDEMGHARSFTLDTTDSVRERARKVAKV